MRNLVEEFFRRDELRTGEELAPDLFFHRFLDETIAASDEGLFGLKKRGTVRHAIEHTGSHLVILVSQQDRPKYLEYPTRNVYEPGPDGLALRQPIPDELVTAARHWLDKHQVRLQLRMSIDIDPHDIPSEDIRYLPPHYIIAGIRVGGRDSELRDFGRCQIEFLPNIPNRLGLSPFAVQTAIHASFQEYRGQ